LRIDRVPPYCSKKCQVTVDGYQPAYQRELDLKMLRSKIEGGLAWAPPPPEAAKHLISGYPTAIAGDIHCPMQSGPWTEQFLITAHKFGCRTCIINGDLINADQIGSYHGLEFRRRAVLEDDMDAAEKFLELMCESFDEVYYTLGNHTARLIRMSNGELSIQRLLKMIYDNDKLKISSSTWMILNDNVRVLHPRGYSQIRGKHTSEIAQLYQCHLVTGHHHHSATTVSKDGKFQVIEVGCLANIDLMSYVQADMKNMPFMLNGFAIAMPTGEILNFNKFSHWKTFGLPDVREK
jgi:hypothetical protein